MVFKKIIKFKKIKKYQFKSIFLKYKFKFIKRDKIKNA